MKKNTNRRLRSIDNTQLAKVSGGRNLEQYMGSIQMLELQGMFAPGSAWNEFFGSAAEV